MRAIAVALAGLALMGSSLADSECVPGATDVLTGATCCTAPAPAPGRLRRHLFSRADTCSCCDTKAAGPPLVSTGGTTDLQCGKNFGDDTQDVPGGVTYTLEPCPNDGPYAGQTCFHVRLTAVSPVTDIHLAILDGDGDPSSLPNGLGTWPQNSYCSRSGNEGNCWVPVSVVLSVLNPRSDSLCDQNIIVAAGISISGATCFNRGTVIEDSTPPSRWFMYTKVGFTCPDVCTHSCCCPPPPPQYHWCDIGTAFGYKEGTPNFNGNPVSPALTANSCKRWGWYFYVPSTDLTTGSGLTGTLIVGAGGNDVSKGIPVGTFSASLSGTSFTFSYNLKPGFDLSEVHVYASCSEPSSCAPGRYTYTGSDLDLSGTTDTSITKTFTVGGSCSKYYLIFHAKVSQSIPIETPCGTSVG